MPCNCDYMEAGQEEINASRCLCLLAELDGKKWTRSQWEGYHKDAYNKADKPMLNRLVRELCARLKQEKDVTKYSLELQMWWRDHCAADKKGGRRG